jgi:cutinase
MLLLSYMVASSKLLLLVLYSLTITPSHGAPTPSPNPGFFGAALEALTDDLDLPNVTSIIQTGVKALAELVSALETGQIEQNGLWGLINVNNITTNAHAGTSNTSGTSNILSMINPTTKGMTCPDLAVIFARGTKEPGNMGFLAGPPFTTALQNYANGSSLAVQGVSYPASVAGFLEGGSSIGAAVMAVMANATHEACPKARIVMAGYSQGAQVVRKALDMVGAGAAPQVVNSVVLFGDPRNGTAVPAVDAGRVFVACHEGDNICQGGDLILPAHLSYSSDAPAAAQFVMARSGLGMGGVDAVMDGMGNIPMVQTSQQNLGNMVLGNLSTEKGASKAMHAVRGVGSNDDNDGDNDNDDDDNKQATPSVPAPAVPGAPTVSASPAATPAAPTKKQGDDNNDDD